MHNVSANYNLPTVLNTLQPDSGLKKILNARDSSPTSTSSTSGSSSSSSSNNAAAATFLNLLSTELQNQDPTDPVDSNEMVSQMISLNQLDQLISINQVLTGSSGTIVGLSQTPAGSAAPSAATGGVSSGQPAVTNPLPFDPNTMMPLGFSNSNAAATDSALSAASMASSSTNHNNSGGK
ncbi:MAG: flagellar hook capping FlgD N-terminal domain-containing protein [Acidobacteriaceae bacterium]